MATKDMATSMDELEIIQLEVRANGHLLLAPYHMVGWESEFDSFPLIDHAPITWEPAWISK